MKKEGNGFLSDMEFTIRKAAAADRAALAYLESILKTRSEPDFADLVFMEHDSGNRTLFLGYDGETPAGYVILNHHPAYPPFIRLQIPEIQDLNVLPEYRRNGLGAKLVQACEAQARAQGAERIGLAVGLDRSYGPAQRLYVRLGYIPDGSGVTHDRQPVAPGAIHAVDDDLCLMMVKDLV